MKLMDWLLGLPAVGLGLWLIFHTPDLTWHEEVQLQTGEVIVIQRTAKFSGNPMPGGGGESSNKEMTIEFKSPGQPDNPARWRGLHVPMILDRDPDTHEWVIVAASYQCESWIDRGSPPSPYVTYRYREGKWMEHTLDSKWIGRDANVISISPSNGIHISGRNPIFTISEKNKLIRDRPEISLQHKKVVDSRSKSC